MTAIASRHDASDNEPFPHDLLTTGILDEVVGVVERLSAEFATIGIGELTAVVVECRSDLSGVPTPALPEMLERLARVRLTAAVG